MLFVDNGSACAQFRQITNNTVNIALRSPTQPALHSAFTKELSLADNGNYWIIELGSLF